MTHSFFDHVTQVRAAGAAPAKVSLDQLKTLFGSWLDDLLTRRPIHGPNSRRRLLTPCVTFLAFLPQVLSPASACQEIISKIHCLTLALGHFLDSLSTSAYCKVRKRLELKLLKEVASQMGNQVATMAPAIPFGTDVRSRW